MPNRQCAQSAPAVSADVRPRRQLYRPKIPCQEGCDEIDDREVLALEPNCVSGNIKILSRRHNLIPEWRGCKRTPVDRNYNPRSSTNHTVWAQGFSSHHSPTAVTPVSFDGR
ncbi:MAG: hypothetical protein DWI29_05195 [Planctomycetota bacterium]|nr:MAG: hypothetical protein DWI29_05195 [Planctomycetota bacterium]